MKLTMTPGTGERDLMIEIKPGIPPGTSPDEPGGEIPAASWPMQLEWVFGPTARTTGVEAIMGPRTINDSNTKVDLKA